MATRIGLASLLQRRTGSVALPEEITLACPNCGELAADKGNCLVEIAMVCDPELKPPMRAKLRFDCRSCNVSGGELAIVDNKSPLSHESVSRAIDQHFAQTPADEVVRRAEDLRPRLENENRLAYRWVMNWIRPKPGA